MDGGGQIRGSGPDGLAMTVPGEYRPARCGDVLELDLGEELILHQTGSSLVHHLNPSAALVWRLCDGTVTVTQMAGRVARKHGIDAREAKTQIAVVVAEFDALDLVEDLRRRVRGGRADAVAP